MKQFAVIGNPIQHSLSPCMHRANFKALGIEANYELKQVVDLSQEIEVLKQLDGFNVTLPYKQLIIPFLDEVDPIALKIGAVNTVKNESGKLIGYNTDVDGFFESFQTLEVEKLESILILGAGGAARAVYFALIKNGYQNITIANRTLDKAKDICDNSISLVQAGEQLATYKCVINTTSVGLVEGKCPIDLKNLNSNHVVMDLIYKPKLTTLLKQAKALNCRYECGLDMLLIQGAKAFEIWFNQKANRTMMKQQLEVELYVNR